MKKLFLLLCTLSVCLSAYSQITMSGSQPKKSATHSNTIIIKNVDTRLSTGWHGMVDVGPGVHVYSANHEGPTIAASLSGFYECNCGFTAGLTAGYLHWVGDGSRYAEPFMNEFRLMAVLGWAFGRKHHNCFILLQPGFASGHPDYFGFSADLKVGYRYMFNSHLGIAVSTGLSGVVNSVMSVPLTIGFVF